MSSIVKFSVHSVPELKQLVDDVINRNDIEPRTATVIIELAQNMLHHCGGGIIFKNGVKIHAWHDNIANSKDDLKTLTHKINLANKTAPEELEGLGFYMMLKEGWKVRAFQRREKLLVSLRRTNVEAAVAV